MDLAVRCRELGARHPGTVWCVTCSSAKSTRQKSPIVGMIGDLSPVNLHLGLARSLDALVASLTLILAGAVLGSRDVSVVPPATAVGLGREQTASAGVLHVVQVSLEALLVIRLLVEPVQTHVLAVPLEVDLVTRVHLKWERMGLE